MSRATYPGVYQARVVSVAGDGRSVIVTVPEVFATKHVTVTDFLGGFPAGGGAGWLTFESGNPAYPVWMGAREPSQQTRLAANSMSPDSTPLNFIGLDNVAPDDNFRGLISITVPLDHASGIWNWTDFDETPTDAKWKGGVHDGHYWLIDHAGTIPSTVPGAKDEDVRPGDRLMAVGDFWRVLRTHHGAEGLQGSVVVSDVPGYTPTKVVDSPEVGMVFINTADQLSFIYAMDDKTKHPKWYPLLPSHEYVRGQVTYVGPDPLTVSATGPDAVPANAQPDPAIVPPLAGDIYVRVDTTGAVNPDFTVLDGTKAVSVRGLQVTYIGSGPLDMTAGAINHGMPLDTNPVPEGLMTPKPGDLYVDVYNGTISVLS